MEEICKELATSQGTRVWCFDLKNRVLWYFDAFGKKETQQLTTPSKEWVAEAMARKPCRILYKTEDVIIYVSAAGDAFNRAEEDLNRRLNPLFGFSALGSPIDPLPHVGSINFDGILKELELLKAENKELKEKEKKTVVATVTIVKDYGPQSHALFNVPEFLAKEMAYYSAIRRYPLFSYNPSLTMRGQKCPGWIIRSKDALQEVKNLLWSFNVALVEPN